MSCFPFGPDKVTRRAARKGRRQHPGRPCAPNCRSLPAFWGRPELQEAQVVMSCFPFSPG
eukprot:3510970-Alexandrium_andersonii.AAC.1